MELWSCVFGILISTLEELLKKMEKSSVLNVKHTLAAEQSPSLVVLSTRHSLELPKSPHRPSFQTEMTANAEVQAHPIIYSPTKLPQNNWQGKAGKAAILKPDL